jgi:hypothetical protein
VADQTLNNTKAGFDVLAAVVMNSSIFEWYNVMYSIETELTFRRNMSHPLLAASCWFLSVLPPNQTVSHPRKIFLIIISTRDLNVTS